MGSVFFGVLLAEITFWACLLLGFAFRYFFKLPRAGIALLIATPVIDLVLLGFTYYTLSQENQASFMHGFAAFYISFSVVFGRDVIAAVDRKLNGSTEISVGTSSADGLKKCVVASAITAVLLAIGIAITGWHIGSFWLMYWLIAVLFTPLGWWGIDTFLQRREQKKSA